MLILPVTHVVLPDRIQIVRPISFERAISTLQRNPRTLQRRVEHLAKNFGHPDPGMMHQMESIASDTAAWPVRRGLLAAAASGSLPTYVRDEINRDFYEITADAWRGSVYACNPMALACTGILAIHADFLFPAERGRRLYGAPIFFDEVEFYRVTLLRDKVSFEEAMAEAKDIVERVLETHPKKRILKAEFWQQMKAQCGRITDKLLTCVWRSDTVPEAWRRPGSWNL